ncbi:MAG: hypothetical protein RL757_2862 [Bacteroidota bacterium]|jgi:prephenate dehydrogenase
MKIAIVGLGLIGGSLAISLRKSGFATSILGFDASPTHAQTALKMGLIDEIGSDTGGGLSAAQMVIVATPVGAMCQILPKILDEMLPRQIVVEVGSTKEMILKSVENHPNRSQLVATHPMAGTEFSGPEAAIEQLFEHKNCVLCDIEKSSETAHQLVLEMYKYLKMNILYMDAENHDLHAAYVSHISHISSFALALTVLEKESDESKIFDLASGGFQSTVRLAKSNPKTWIPIFEQNRDNVLDVLDEHIHILSTMRSHLLKRRFEEFEKMIEKANDIRRILK